MPDRIRAEYLARLSTPIEIGGRDACEEAGRNKGVDKLQALCHSGQNLHAEPRV